MVSLKELLGFEVRADDGVAGSISDFLINERTWAVGYVIVPIGGYLSGERLLIAVDDITLGREDRAIITARSLVELAALSPADLATKAEEGWATVNDQAPRHIPASDMPEPQSPWRSFNMMLGCTIAASDGGYGSLDDLLVDFEEWRIQYFVGRTYKWKKKPSVLIPTAWVEQVSWMDKTVDVSVSREALEREPTYKPASHTQTQ